MSRNHVWSTNKIVQTYKVERPFTLAMLENLRAEQFVTMERLLEILGVYHPDDVFYNVSKGLLEDELENARIKGYEYDDGTIRYDLIDILERQQFVEVGHSDVVYPWEDVTPNDDEE